MMSLAQSQTSSHCGSDFHRLADLLPNDPRSRSSARHHAASRGWTLDQLARRLLEAVIEDDLVSAVLDDGAGQ